MSEYDEPTKGAPIYLPEICSLCLLGLGPYYRVLPLLVTPKLENKKISLAISSAGASFSRYANNVLEIVIKLLLNPPHPSPSIFLRLTLKSVEESISQTTLQKLLRCTPTLRLLALNYCKISLDVLSLLNRLRSQRSALIWKLWTLKSRTYFRRRPPVAKETMKGIWNISDRSHYTQSCWALPIRSEIKHKRDLKRLSLESSDCEKHYESDLVSRLKACPSLVLISPGGRTASRRNIYIKEK